MLTADDVLLFSALTAALSAWLTAAFALRRSQQALRATRAKKPNAPSLEESSSELSSALAAEKISHQLQKLENRLRMRELRDPERRQAPREGSSKAELFRHYGFDQVGPRFAQRQLDLERQQQLNGKGD